jgi:hypothetical protein
MTAVARACWGPWRLSGTRLADDQHGYDVELLTCTSSAEVLDWLCQITAKDWGSPHVVGHLVRAFNEVLNPQANLCSWGQPMTMTKAQIRQVILDYRLRRSTA